MRDEVESDTGREGEVRGLMLSGVSNLKNENASDREDWVEVERLQRRIRRRLFKKKTNSQLDA
jgi:hypothetical protein